MADYIDQFQMVRLSKKPTRPHAQWRRKVRTGVDGVALWGTGQRADVLELESKSIAADLTAAMNLYYRYTQLATKGAIRVIFADYQEPNVLYKVLAVEPVTEEVRAQLRGHYAGLATNFQGWLVCHWQLQPVFKRPP